MTESNTEISSIPILDGTNYGEWSARITILLRSKDLLQFCENIVASDASTMVMNKWNKSSFEAVRIITSHVSNRVFIDVVKQNSANAHLLWTELQEKPLIGDVKLMMAMETVNIVIPSKLLSFTLLGKLSGDSKIHQYVETLSLNEELIELPDLILSKLQDFHNNSTMQEVTSTSSASALLSESTHPYKILYYCTNGKHNPMCTSHTKQECFVENPHLRPPRRNNKRRAQNNQNVLAHLSTAQALVTSDCPSTFSFDLIIDCGATHHMFNSKESFSTLGATPSFNVCTGDTTSSLSAKGIGTVTIACGEKVFTLSNCLYVPNLNCNLISLLGLGHKKISIHRDKDDFTLCSEDEILFKGKIESNLMKVNYSTPKTPITQSSNLWHLQLGHPGVQVIRSMGLPEMTSKCLTCDKNKMHLLPFKDQFEQVSLPLDCFHIDLVGPISSSSISGFRYFLTIVDQATSFKTIRLLKQKSDAFHQFVLVKKAMENFHDRTLKRLVSDRGGEFLNHQFQRLSEECGFEHLMSPAETPQHNGVAERANCTILEKAHCLLNGSNLPSTYWAEAVNTATLLSNLTPTPSRVNRSPYSLWKGSPPRIKKLRVFGCRAIIAIPKQHRKSKFSPSGAEGILLGYTNENTAYRILRLWDQKVIISRHVIFDESTFPSLKDRSSSFDSALLIPEYQEAVTEVVDEARSVDMGQVDEILPIEPILDEPSIMVDEIQDSSETAASDRNCPACSSRIKVIGPCHPTLISSDVNSHNILPYSRRPKALLSIHDETPRTFKQAINSANKDVWNEAIKKELASMNRLSVWDVIDLKSDYKLVGTTWVFRTKRNHLNEVVDYKARLCAQGFTQTPGLDFGKPYAPTGRLNSLRTLIAFAASTNLSFHQVDIKSAFLNAPLSETVYLSIPQGLDLDRRKNCLRLNKAIYGLKQAPLAWYERLKDWLKKVGFVACLLDPCVFYRQGSVPLWLYVHVDDIAIFGKDVESFKKEISEEFDIKDVGPADLMLGVKINHSKDFISLDQQHFTKSLLDLYGMSMCKTVSTPLPPHSHLGPPDIEEVIKFKQLNVNYRSAIGSINYLSTATRPNLSHAVSTLSQFLVNLGIQHWNAFLHVLKYLNGTQEIGLVYTRNCSRGIRAYSDADWGNFPETRRSVTGFLVTFNDSLVIWKTRKQPTVSISTAEAEYKALCDLKSELVWFRQWCDECSLYQNSSPIPVHEDNQSCINTVEGHSNVNHKRMKHVDIKLHFIKEFAEKSVIQLIYTPTNLMLADFLTKSVSRPTLSCSLDSLGVLRLGVKGGVENHNQDQSCNQLNRSAI
ncbi:hypothetical protein O181_038815 [Austropuccinia psidii MF-1]|uniref:Integrase catalytic domain-containing protein n=1 Tax=Austropuccinia psidii MF-1 TaxID=1389203 RepID=A0A9Q3DDM4_9BASI|nr:hypothetical protein [Austropuccinia psidii MF-1]